MCEWKSMTTILYVDDEIMNLELFEFHMKKKYNLFLAESGPAGLELLEKESNISIVLTDMRMPVMNGLEFIQKAKVNYPDVTFFILTGYDITPEISAAMESGMIHKYFSKPYDLNDIEVAINEIKMKD